MPESMFLLPVLRAKARLGDVESSDCSWPVYGTDLSTVPAFMLPCDDGLLRNCV
jgi:hypothetical protein